VAEAMLETLSIKNSWISNETIPDGHIMRGHRSRDVADACGSVLNDIINGMTVLITTVMPRSLGNRSGKSDCKMG
jgi:hypothetical protein